MAVITVSGGIYSGGKELASLLSERLGYRLVSQEALLPREDSRLGSAQDEPEATLSQEFGLDQSSQLRTLFYTAYMQVVMCEDARSDGVVYHGQAAHLFLKDLPHHFGVRVMADMELRINNAMKYRLLDREKASDLIQKLDDGRDRWMRSIFHADRNDPSQYDMVVNATTLGIADACDMIGHAVTTQITTPADAQRAIDDLLLAAELRVRIALEKDIRKDHVEIAVCDGVVTVIGVAGSVDDADRIRDLIRRYPGVADVDSRMGVRHW